MDNFKKLNRPSACTETPFKYLIPKEIREEVLLKIKYESIDLHGEDLSGECNKRLVCASKTCLGRPLPTLSPTAKPYLEQLAKTHNIVDNKLFITTDCSTCPIVKTCSSTCNQINDYVDRFKTEEPTIYYRPITEEIVAEDYTEEGINFTVNGSDIPWDCLSKQWLEIVKMYMYEKKDYKHIADNLGLNNETIVKYKFYLALTKLSKYGTIRKFLKTNPKLPKKRKFIVEQYFLHNKSRKQICEELNITNQVCQRHLTLFYKTNNLKWKKFVRKQGTEIIYNIPMIVSR